MNSVVITGHSSGIGKACTRFFLDNDISVIGISNTKSDISNESLIEFQCDLSLRHKRKGVIKELVQSYSPLYGLINNAGVLDLEENYPKSYDRLMCINMEAPLHLSLGLVGIIRKNGFIINVASVSGMRGEENQLIYGMAKAGVISMTKSLAIKFAKDNIRVNSVSPGFINTPLCPGDTPSFLIEQIPMKREGEPVEVAKAIWDLSYNSYITGANLVIDGGLSA